MTLKKWDFIAYKMNIVSLRRGIDDMVIVNNITWQCRNVITHVVILFLWHYIIHWITSASTMLIEKCGLWHKAIQEYDTPTACENAWATVHALTRVFIWAQLYEHSQFRSTGPDKEEQVIIQCDSSLPQVTIHVLSV